MSTTLDILCEFWWIFTNRLNVLQIWAPVAAHLLAPVLLLSLWVQILEHPFTGTPNISLISCLKDTIIPISVHLFQEKPSQQWVPSNSEWSVMCPQRGFRWGLCWLIIYLWQWSQPALRDRDFRHAPTLLGEKERKGVQWVENKQYVNKSLFHCAGYTRILGL